MKTLEAYLTRDNLIAAGLALFVLLTLLILFWRSRRGGEKEPEILDPRERLRHALGKTRGGLLDAIRKTFRGKIDEEVIGSLEEILLAADIGVATTDALLEGLKAAYRKGEIQSQAQVLDYLKAHLKEKLGGAGGKLNMAEKPPTVILVCGVNGCGKTTSIAKLTYYFAQQGKKVLLCASDTFRAAAVDQLNTWADRLGVAITRGQQGADPASVAHDAHEKALKGGFDVLIVDTAGRLHNDKNLMRELEKIARVGKKHVPDSPHEVLLVLDATTGQNAIRQAEAFTEAIQVTGIVLAKLDGTAKGGMIVPIREELGIPVKFVGLGERPTDLAPFDADTFVEGMFS
ncbi:MAG: signal recognition particle-docking protein FtsY [Planctomycetota bacterium]|nr:MAG: signal recognition particle-docking protein FtsY [Planctomycetota bacterium]